MKHPTTHWNALSLAAVAACLATASCAAEAVPAAAAVADAAADAPVAASDSVAQPDAPVADVADDTPLPPAPDATAATDTAWRSADAAPLDVDAAPTPQSPLQATGGFVEIKKALGPALAVDAGVKGQKDPLANAGLLVDLDKDDLLDVVLTDGIFVATWGRAVQPFKWIHAPLLKVNQPGLRSLAATDVDMDGWPEIVLGGAKLHYMVRQKGETYTDEAKARGLYVDGNVAVQSLTVVDLDSDGLLDLVAALYACSDDSRLLAYVNQGNGTYEERAEALGLMHVASYWHVLATDVDGDRQPDLLAMTEACEPKGGNAYFHNRSFLPGKAYELKPLAPVFLAPGSSGGGTPMGGSVGDVNNDGLLDYVMSETGYREQRMGGMNMRKPDLAKLAADDGAGNHLLIRNKDGTFKSVGVAAGIAVPLSETGQTMVSWSARLFDFDADGHLDLLMTHGWDFDSSLLADEGGTRPTLHRNLGDGTFAEVSAAFGLPMLHYARAMAAADLDDDGDLDFLMGGQMHQPLLFRNDIVHPNQWLQVRLRGSTSNTYGLGARVELVTDVRTFTSELSMQAPTQTADQPIVHIGIPKGQKPKSLRVLWPSGYDQTVPLANFGQRVTVVEPPLVTLSHRFITSTATAVVGIQARGFDANGAFMAPGYTVTIEMAPGAKGTWQGPISCAGNGECNRHWQPPVGGKGETAFVVSIDGKTLGVRPKVRYAAPGFGP